VPHGITYALPAASIACGTVVAALEIQEVFRIEGFML
jgi:hypothetical protein